MNLKSLLTKLLPILSYLIVGALATIVEWTFFYLFNNVCNLHYQVATVIAIVISTFSNWMFGRLLTFRNAEKKSLIAEISKIYLVSIVGLLLNMFLMWIFVEKIDLTEMISKIIATCIVFSYNYSIRKFFIYKKTSNN